MRGLPSPFEIFRLIATIPNARLHESNKSGLVSATLSESFSYINIRDHALNIAEFGFELRSNQATTLRLELRAIR